MELTVPSILGIVFGILPVAGGLGLFLVLKLIAAIRWQRNTKDGSPCPPQPAVEQLTLGLKPRELALFD